MALPGRSSRRRRTIFWQVRDWLGEQSRQSPCGGSPNPTGRRSWKGDPNSKDLPLTSVDAIRRDFAFLDDWEDRYRYVLELGRTLEPLSEAAHNGANKVRGCVSQFFRELGLEQHLTPQRSNGVRAMIERIRADAAASGSALFPRSASPNPGAFSERFENDA
jgi:hypothetical protein